METCSDRTQSRRLRRLTGRIFCWICLFVLSGCGDDPRPSEEEPVKPAAVQPSGEGPDYGGRILMGSIGEPSNLIPYLSSDSASSQVTSLLYTAPLEYDKDYQIVKLAAESWEVLEEGRLMRFRLREGLQWQDGTPLTADDVTFTYETMINPRTPTAYAADFLNIK